MHPSEGYRLVEGPPSVDDYGELRRRSGLSPKSREQCAAAVAGAWKAVHVVAPDGTTVGMGRVIGDGGWYFHIIDMAVLPEHQRRGLGAAVLTWLLDAIDAHAAPGQPYISLIADAPGRPLYAKHGFVPTAPAGIGMMLAKRA